MLSELRIEKLTRQGIALLQEEREAALKGDLGQIAEINAKKASFLDEMARLAERLDEGGPAELRAARRQELETLFEIMRRRAEENQALLRAASEGVQSAQSRLAALAASADLMGAYTAKGEQVQATPQANLANQLL
ncbi:MAG: hypothetical protein AAF909_03165 [Pseudomonadota bacterium]